MIDPNILSVIVCLAAASIATAMVLGLRREIQEIRHTKLLADVDGQLVRQALRGCREQQAKLINLTDEAQALIVEVRTVLALAPAAPDPAEFRPDDVIGLGPHPLVGPVPPLGGDGDGGHMHDEEDGGWGCL